MARRIATASEGELRAYLLAEAAAVRDLLCGPQPTPTGGRTPAQPVADADWVRAWQTPVDELAGGGEYRLRRNDLPDWHAEAHPAGDPNDEFVLGADDVLRCVS